MDTGEVVASTIATVSLTATALLAYRQTRLQARLTAIEQTRQRQAVAARQRADVRATVTGTPTALQLVLSNHGPASASAVWASVLPVGSDDPPIFHGLNELEQAPAALRPGDRLPFLRPPWRRQTERDLPTLLKGASSTAGRTYSLAASPLSVSPCPSQDLGDLLGVLGLKGLGCRVER